MAEAFEKTQAPTPRRRADARRKGQVARSADLASAAVLLAAVAMMQTTGPRLIAAIKSLLASALSKPSIAFTWNDIANTSAQLGRAVVPLIGAVIVIAIAANLLQFGFLFRRPINESALDIGKGFERIFSPKSRARLVIDLLKLTTILWLGYSLVRQCTDRLVGLQSLDAIPSFSVGGAIVFGIAIRMAVLLLTLGVLDYAYQRWQHERDLRMTPREIKDELRQMEGDPQTKQIRRAFAGSLFSSRMDRAAASADALVTHENQLAIAIRYDRRSMLAPRVIAKGAGASVASLRKSAAAAGVPIVEQEPLARALSKLTSVGGDIPHQLYSAIAEVLAYAAAARGGERS